MLSKTTNFIYSACIIYLMYGVSDLDRVGEENYARPRISSIEQLVNMVNSISVCHFGKYAPEETTKARLKAALEIPALYMDNDELYKRTFNGEGVIALEPWNGEKIKPISKEDYIKGKAMVAEYLGISMGQVRKLMRERKLKYRSSKYGIPYFILENVNKVRACLKKEIRASGAEKRRSTADVRAFSSSSAHPQTDLGSRL